MTDLGAAAARQRRRIEDMEWERYPMAASIKIWKGSIVMLNAAGNATIGADTASCFGLGIAKETVDNTAGSAGDKSVDVEFGQVLGGPGVGARMSDGRQPSGLSLPRQRPSDHVECCCHRLPVPLCRGGGRVIPHAVHAE